MSRTQIGLRLESDEADALREAARERRMSLGELVTTLLRESRAEGGKGIWLDLSEASTVALRAVAAAADSSPEEVLRGFAKRWLADDLARLRQELSGGDRRGVTAEEPDGPRTDEAFEEPDDVLFTVSED